MRSVIGTLVVLTLAGCTGKKAPPAAPVDIDSLLNGTRPPQQLSLIDEFRATSHDGGARTRDNLLGQPTVMWFFPAAATSGCTVEGCGYRDLYADFQKLGIQIVGVTFTDLETNRGWAEDQGFPYEIWRDDDKTLALYYGAASKPDQQYANRRTKVFDPQGTLVLEYVDKLIVGAHPREVLEDVQLLWPPASKK